MPVPRSQVLYLLGVALLSVASIGTSARAQFRSDGMYYDGMHAMNWSSGLPIRVLQGKAVVDSVAPLRGEYFLDTTNLGTARHFRLFFGPWWYRPASGATRPTNGESISIKGGLIPYSPVPTIVEYEMNGLRWRDSVTAPPWSGHWIHRNLVDTATIYCPTDSLSRARFSSGFMGMGMMGGGMMWPDSLFCQFEQMHPDSLPGMPRGQALMGFHLDAFNPQGTPLMQSGGMGHGSMTFQQPVRMRFHLDPDSLSRRGLSMNQVALQFLDSDNQWKVATSQIVDASTGSITVSQLAAYSFYALVPSGATSVETSVASVPGEFTLDQNYPNPFNPTTMIRFRMSTPGIALLKVYDGLGRKVATLVDNKVLGIGEHAATFDADALPTGTYVYRLEINGTVLTRKMLLVR